MKLKLNEKEYEVEITQSATVWWYKFQDQNDKKEKLTVELVECHSDPKDKKSFGYLWHKHGYTDKILNTYWSLYTHVTDSENECHGKYNPQHKLSDDGKRVVINFDFMFEATDEHKIKLLSSVAELFFSATGKSATEIKRDKVYAFAKERNLKIYNKMPDGWVKEKCLTYPIGAQMISNKQKIFTKENGEIVINPKRRIAILLNQNILKKNDK